jgi:hypothetical protein
MAMISSARDSIASAIFNKAFCRCDGVESRHPGNASLAALKAESTSAALDLGARAYSLPVEGFISGELSPDVESTELPLMKLVNFSMELSLPIPPLANQ